MAEPTGDRIMMCRLVLLACLMCYGIGPQTIYADSPKVPNIPVPSEDELTLVASAVRSWDILAQAPDRERDDDFADMLVTLGVRQRIIAADMVLVQQCRHILVDALHNRALRRRIPHIDSIEERDSGWIVGRISVEAMAKVIPADPNGHLVVFAPSSFFEKAEAEFLVVRVSGQSVHSLQEWSIPPGYVMSGRIDNDKSGYRVEFIHIDTKEKVWLRYPKDPSKGWTVTQTSAKGEGERGP